MEFQLIDQNNFSSNHIGGFVDHQYLWMELINVLDILHRDIHQFREILKVVLPVMYGQTWPVTPKFA